MMEQAKVLHQIAASPDRVWKTLTSNEGAKAYMMGAEVDADWRQGGKMTIRGEYQGKRFEDHAEVRTFEPEKELAYTHVSGAAPDHPHMVVFRLAPKDGGTELTVTQAGDEAPSAEEKARYEKTWWTMVEALARAAAR